jgi:alkylated DNA nucleotide flippase Atl1
MAAKSWNDKLHVNNDLPKTVTLDPKEAKRLGGQTMVVPHPLDVDAIMRTVPKGKVITTAQIRQRLARKYQTDTACPLTTGIFAKIAAHASVENGDDLPWWRTLKTGGELNPKFPGAPHEQIALLEHEGHTIATRGHKHLRYFVEGYDNSLSQSEP